MTQADQLGASAERLGRAQEDVCGPAELVLTASVARRYYVDGRSKTDIAGEFAISRFRVARLLDSARTRGLVRIEIGHPGSIDVDLSDRLREHLGLRTAVVVDTPEHDRGALRALLGSAAADLLRETLRPHDVLGLAWARAVATMVRSLSSLPRVRVVQLTGSLTREDLSPTSIEMVRDVARLTGAPASFFYAPFLLPDAQTAAALRRQPDIARAMDQFSSVTKAVVGLGAWKAGHSTIYDAMSTRDRRALARAGVVADVSGVFLDEDGQPVGQEHTARMICMTADELRRVPDVLAIPYGAGTESAVRAGVRSGLVSRLVTHSQLARQLLAQPAVARPTDR